MLSIAERHKYILDALARQGYIRVFDIANEMGVTVVTVRKDLKLLEDKGLLYRSHGSASPANPHVPDRSVSVKEQINRSEKEKIGAEAAKLIGENDSVIIASGSTIYAFVEHIRPVGKLNVITPSIQVAMRLCPLGEDVNIIQLGGVINKKALSVQQGVEVEVFDRVSTSKLFIGVDGIDVEHGITTSNLEEVELTRRMMAATAKVVALADSSKFSKRGFGKICPLEQIDVIVTDEGVLPNTVKLLEEAGIKVIIAR